MRIDEIKAASAAEKRVKALKANAEREKRRAQDARRQADISAERLANQVSRR